MITPKMMPGQRAYTPEEWARVQQEIADIAKYLEDVGDDIAEMQAKDSRRNDP